MINLKSAVQYVTDRVSPNHLYGSNVPTRDVTVLNFRARIVQDKFVILQTLDVTKIIICNIIQHSNSLVIGLKWLLHGNNTPNLFLHNMINNNPKRLSIASKHG